MGHFDDLIPVKKAEAVAKSPAVTVAPVQPQGPIQMAPVSQPIASPATHLAGIQPMEASDETSRLMGIEPAVEPPPSASLRFDRGSRMQVKEFEGRKWIKTGPSAPWKEVKPMAQAGSKLTEGQEKTSLYLGRATKANENILSSLSQFDPTSLQGAGSALATKSDFTNWLAPPEAQKFTQAADEFIAAVLRKDTGAAIAKDEKEQAYRIYIPRPGDTPEVMEQKRVARERAVEELQKILPGAPKTGGAKVASPAATPAAANDKDAQAASWLKANPGHPKAAAIRAALKAKGIAVE